MSKGCTNFEFEKSKVKVASKINNVPWRKAFKIWCQLYLLAAAQAD